MSSVESQISRMKAMMNYGLQTENKNVQYTSVEYQKLGADGKTYGIVREGTKFYIKVSDSKKPNLLKESFDYIGGFINRKNNEYTSYANALKHFDMKMMSLKEATGNKKLMVESWNPEKNEYLVVEATDKMKNEIARQRQIMENASNIMENKAQECGAAVDYHGKKIPSCAGAPFCEGLPEGTDMEGGVKATKNNVKKAQKPVVGKGAKKNVKESDEHWAWHRTGGDAHETMNDTDLDTSNGTEIGDGAPFNECPKCGTKAEMKNGTVEEEAMHNSQNQNSPKVGVGEVGDDDPFVEKDTMVKEGEELPKAPKQVNNLADDEANDEKGWWEDKKKGLHEADEDNEDMDDVESDDALADTEAGDEDAEDFSEEDFGEPTDGEDDVDLDDTEDLGDEDFEDEMEADEDDENAEIEDLKDEIADLKDMISLVMDKLDVSSEEEADIEFDDEPLYDDDEEPMDDEADFEIELDDEEPEEDAEDFDDDAEDFDNDAEDEDDEVFESRSYRRMKALNEDRLDYFGKHPAYRKKVMTLPKNGEDSNEHGRDWNDDSVHGEQPYGEKIGSGAPFEVDPQEIENAIAESVKRVLRRK